MSTFKERPFSQFNHLMNFGSEDASSHRAGFQEVSGLSVEVSDTEYRSSVRRFDAHRSIPGARKPSQVTLKRGVIPAVDLYQWLNQVRAGVYPDGVRNVQIELLAQDGITPAITWTLLNARPIKYTGPSLNGKGGDMAIEELVLSCEAIQFE